MPSKSMATIKFTGGISAFRNKLINGTVGRGDLPMLSFLCPVEAVTL